MYFILFLYIIHHCHLYEHLCLKFFEDIIRKYAYFIDLDDNSKIIFLFTMLILLYADLQLPISIHILIIDRL